MEKIEEERKKIIQECAVLLWEMPFTAEDEILKVGQSCSVFIKSQPEETVGTFRVSLTCYAFGKIPMEWEKHKVQIHSHENKSVPWASQQLNPRGQTFFSKIPWGNYFFSFEDACFLSLSKGDLPAAAGSQERLPNISWDKFKSLDLPQNTNMLVQSDDRGYKIYFQSSVPLRCWIFFFRDVAFLYKTIVTREIPKNGNVPYEKIEGWNEIRIMKAAE